MANAYAGTQIRLAIRGDLAEVSPVVEVPGGSKGRPSVSAGKATTRTAMQRLKPSCCGGSWVKPISLSTSNVETLFRLGWFWVGRSCSSLEQALTRRSILGRAPSSVKGCSCWRDRVKRSALLQSSITPVTARAYNQRRFPRRTITARGRKMKALELCDPRDDVLSGAVKEPSSRRPRADSFAARLPSVRASRFLEHPPDRRSEAIAGELALGCRGREAGERHLPA